MFKLNRLCEIPGNELIELTSDGDFRSEECVELLEESDIVITNPPFSLFREYVNLLVEKDKKFLVLGNVNAITYKEIFPLLMNNKMWLGANTHSGGVAFFYVPDDYVIKSSNSGIDSNGQKYVRLANVRWFTNMDIKQIHEEITLYKRYTSEEYPMYDNYDAINVDKVKDIPYNYPGVIGVPITFMDKYNPDQFEILGIAKTPLGKPNKIYPKHIKISPKGVQTIGLTLNAASVLKVAIPPVGKTYYEVDGEYFVTPYARILVRNKKPIL